jgi:GNAT superfamily N-acetyltransferase
MTVRPATLDDVPAIMQLVRELADYEREPDAVEATEAHFRRALFPRDGHPTVSCLVAETGREVVGIAVWYLTFSTWTGRNGIWLEDLFVRPDHRGDGHGTALLQALAALCVERGYPRLEWWVLDWNAPSIGFYESLGARAEDEWTTFRLSGEALSALGG